MEPDLLAEVPASGTLSGQNPRHLDGVDAEIARPNPAATFELASGLALRQGDEVVTFAARALEPCRGFQPSCARCRKFCDGAPTPR